MFFLPSNIHNTMHARVAAFKASIVLLNIRGFQLSKTMGRSNWHFTFHFAHVFLHQIEKLLLCVIGRSWDVKYRQEYIDATVIILTVACMFHWAQSDGGAASHLTHSKHTQTDCRQASIAPPQSHSFLRWSRESRSLMWNVNFQVSCSVWLRQVSAVTHLGQISSCR